MSDCRDCTKLNTERKAGCTRYICSIGGGEIRQRDLHYDDGDLFSASACPHGGPFHAQGDSSMSKQINWSEEHNGHPLYEYLLRMREEGHSAPDVAQAMNEQFDIDINEQNVYYVSSNYSLDDADEPKATEPEPEPEETLDDYFEVDEATDARLTAEISADEIIEHAIAATSERVQVESRKIRELEERQTRALEKIADKLTAIVLQQGHFVSWCSNYATAFGEEYVKSDKERQVGLLHRVWAAIASVVGM